MSTQFKSMVAGGLLAMLAALSSTAAAAEAGKVVFVAGDVKLSARAAVLDAAVQEGDELSTGADGYVYVKTVDQGFLVLRPNSKARIVAYHIDAANPANTRVKFELLQGVARSISGNGVKHARQNFRFNTPVAAIGVRGTDFVVYTDQQTSRVTVVSGGVVVSGFAGACGPDGGGPCEGGASRELFAGQAGLMLQVQRGQTAPQLLRSPVMSPADQGTPARPDEPVGKVGANGPTDVNLDAQKSLSLLNGAKSLTVAPPPPVVTVPPVVDQSNPPPVVVPPVVVPPVVTYGPSEVLWGRYQAIAGAPADTAVNAQIADLTKYAQAQVLGAYQIARFKDTAYVAPREGTAAFTLTSSDAVLQRTGRDAVQASVQDGRLSVDFGARTFNTSLTVVGDGVQVPFATSGNVTKLGELVNVNSLADYRIKGYVAGASAEEAAYLFQYKNSAVMINGATKWTR
jgi:hypothetical protein